MSDNPLAVPQREKSGAVTFGKYEYQYHWALCRIIDEQKTTREYALFMEYHEDVVFANSLDPNVAQFEFNQVKNVKSPKFNIKNLTKIKKGTSSILGKLISSAISKPFSDKISTINLVASCGFSLDQIDNNLNLDVITVGDLSEASLEALKQALKEELGANPLPENLRFVIPSLSVADQQDSVIGKISALVSSIFPGSHCNADYIYRTLIDELHRKGSVEYDYNKWDELLENKALTSTKVTQTIGAYTSLQDIQQIILEANQIANELGLPYLRQRQMRKNIEDIHIRTIGYPTSISLKIRESILEVLSSVCPNTDRKLVDLIDEVERLLPDKTKKGIGNVDDIRDHIIYEIITRDI